MLVKNHTNIIKGIATFIIVIGHIGNFSGSRYFTFLGGIGVTLFLICSGLGLHKSYEKNGLNGFFKKRLSKVLIPYWIGVIAYNVIYHSEFSILEFIREIFLIKTYSYWWFIQFILISYVVFYLVYRFIAEDKRIACLGVTSVIFFILVKENLWSQQAISFLIGICFAKYNEKKLTTRKALFIGGFAIVIGVMSLAIKQLPIIRDSNYLIFNTNQIILCVGVSIGVIYITYVLLKLSIVRIFSILGIVSYEAYLVHTLFIFIISNSFTVTNIVVYLLVCTLVVYLFYFINSKLLRTKEKSLINSL